VTKNISFKKKVLILIFAVALFTPQKVRAQIPFVCEPSFYQYFGDSLNLLNPETGTYTKIGGSYDIEIGTLGYNVLDNLIYGIGRDTIAQREKLFRIDATGVFEELANIATYGTAGDMNRDDKFLLITATGIHEIDIEEPFAITNHLLINMPTDLPNDIAYIPSDEQDLFYGLEIIEGISYLFEFNLNTARAESRVVSSMIGTALPENGNYSAAWTDSDNNLYVSHSPSGEIFIIDDFSSGSPIASHVLTTQEISDGDGASCPGTKNPFTSDVGDYIWNDVNHNGLQDDYFHGDGDNGLEGIKVTLLNEAGDILDSSQTDKSGKFQFKRLLLGNYKIKLNEQSLFYANLPTFDYDGVVTPYESEFTLSTKSHNNSLDFAFSDMALPIVLTNFTAEMVKDGVRLAWTTESETENQGFFIQRKLEKESEWQELSSFLTNPGLRGQGSITYQSEYEYIDSTDLSEFTYEYRLGDVDYNTAMFFHDDLTIRIEVNYTAIPDNFSLLSAYPNPFNPITTISYSIPENSTVTLFIYDVTGKLVRKLVNNVENPGIKEVVWNGRNEFGKNVHSGMYIYSLRAGKYHESKKILLIR